MGLSIGSGNNGLGINAYSGPMGEKEPAYGAGERLKVLTSLAPVGSPAALNAPNRAKRAAKKGKTMAAAGAPPVAPSEEMAPVPSGLPTEQSPVPGGTYQAQLEQFWQQIAADPNASDLVKAIAARAINGTS